ncbi:MAG: beta-lactamase family protein [Hyphomicrobiales bacterium]|nr:beta-lactamase family protein [Hyphomicrobiales bacterium]
MHHSRTRRSVLAAVICLSFWPMAGARGEATLPGEALSAAERTFTSRPGETRALLVWQDGMLLHERYGAGFGPATRLVSWSAAKSVLATALAILVSEGRIDLDRAPPVAAWRRPGDPRAAITVRHLLTMTSGLDHREGTERGQPIETADTVRMLFAEGALDTAAYAAARPLAHPPGTVWKYSTGTSQILADIVARAITSATDPDIRRRETAQWFHTRIFEPIGIESARWDYDAAGLFLGGSLLHMTAPDYLRLGRLFLDRGRTQDGRHILSESSVDLLTTRAAAANNRNYAGHVWVNDLPAAGQPNAMFNPRGGAGTFAMIGHLGQFVIVVPEKRAVIVRLGRTANKDRPALRDELGALIDALPKPR